MAGETPACGLLAWVRKHYEILLASAIMLLALALRLCNLEASSFWIDELTQLRRVRPNLLPMLSGVAREMGATPLEYIVTHYVYYYIGRSEGILRLPSVLWGFSSVVVIYFLGRRMFDRTTGLLAAALLAITPIHIYYSQEMRPYSLAALFVPLTTLVFHRALSRNTRGAWALYGGTLLAGMYAHYYVAVVGILHGIYLLWMAACKRLPCRSLRPYVAAAGIAGLLFLPWVAWDVSLMVQSRQGSGAGGWAFGAPDVAALLRAPFIVPGSSYPLTAGRPLTWFLAISCIAVACGVALAIARRGEHWNKVGLIALVGLGGVASVMGLDVAFGYFYTTRQVVPFGPVIVLLVCAAWVTLFRAGWGRLARGWTSGASGALAAILLAALAVWALADPLAATYRSRKHDIRGASRYLLQHVDREDIVLTRIPYYFEIYVPELADQIVELEDMVGVQEEAQTHQRVWIVDRTESLRNRT